MLPAGYSEIRGAGSLKTIPAYKRFILRLSERSHSIYPGLTQRQIANELNVTSGSAISKQIVRSRKIIKDNSELSCQVEKCEAVWGN